MDISFSLLKSLVYQKKCPYSVLGGYRGKKTPLSVESGGKFYLLEKAKNHLI